MVLVGGLDKGQFDFDRSIQAELATERRQVKQVASLSCVLNVSIAVATKTVAVMCSSR